MEDRGPKLQECQHGSIRKFQSSLPAKPEPGEVPCQSQEARLEKFWKNMASPGYNWGNPEVLEDSSPWNSAKDFLDSFEQVATACRWPKETWVAQLLPALSGEARKAFIRLDTGDREDYGTVKAALLRWDALRREEQRQHFRCFCYREADGPRGACQQLRERCHRWLWMEGRSKEQILELLILEQFLAILPPEMQSWVKEQRPETCSQAVALAESFLLSFQEDNQKEKKVALEETSRIRSHVTPSPSEWGQLQVVIKHEAEAGENSLTADALWESATQPQPCGILSKRTNQEELRENIWEWERDGSKTQDEDQMEKRVKSLQEGSVCGIPVRLENHTEKIRKKCSGPPWRLFTGEKPNHHFKFGKNLGQRLKLTKSQIFHLGEKPYTCPMCGKSFNWSTNLTSHQRIHTGERPYKCLDCGKTFCDQSGLVKHKRIHTGEKPYQCLICGKRFSQNTHLTTHQRMHTGEKPYKCSACGAGFSRKTYLIAHQRTHSEEIP